MCYYNKMVVKCPVCGNKETHGAVHDTANAYYKSVCSKCKWWYEFSYLSPENNGDAKATHIDSRQEYSQKLENEKKTLIAENKKLREQLNNVREKAEKYDELMKNKYIKRIVNQGV